MVVVSMSPKQAIYTKLWHAHSKKTYTHAHIHTYIHIYIDVHIPFITYQLQRQRSQAPPHCLTYSQIKLVKFSLVLALLYCFKWLTNNYNLAQFFVNIFHTKNRKHKNKKKRKIEPQSCCLHHIKETSAGRPTRRPNQKKTK